MRDPVWLGRFREHLAGRVVDDFRPGDRRSFDAVADRDEIVPSQDETAEFFETMEVLDELLFGRTIAIEYENAKGDSSLRRITVKRVKASGGRVQIHAVCHESNGFRCFRLDRIGAIIDRHGEVFEPAESFFENEFELDITPLLKGGRIRMPRVQVPPLKKIAPGVAVLGAIAHCDGFLHEEEVQVILQFADRIAFNEGSSLTNAQVDLVAKNLQSYMTPDVATLNAASDWIVKYKEGPLLARYARAVAEADNKLVQNEVDLLIMLSTELAP